MKKTFLFFTFLSLSTTALVFASSGACSDHGGVNCTMSPSYSGNVMCNDGWSGSSVPYVSECQTPRCPAELFQKMFSDYNDNRTQLDNLNNQISQVSGNSSGFASGRQASIQEMKTAPLMEQENYLLSNQKIVMHNIDLCLSMGVAREVQQPQNTAICPPNSSLVNGTCTCNQNTTFDGTNCILKPVVKKVIQQPQDTGLNGNIFDPNQTNLVAPVSTPTPEREDSQDWFSQLLNWIKFW